MQMLLTEPVLVPEALDGLAGASLLELADLRAVELESLLDLAAQLKAAQSARTPHPLAPGRTLGMLFAKRSTRTRVSFEVGMFQLGGNALHLSLTDDLQVGRGETLRDTAMVLSRYLDAIVFRAASHSDLEELAAFSSVPVINGLTDRAHPCQALADLLTLRERFGDLQGRRLTWVGDASNVCRSLACAAALSGMHMVVASPDGYGLDAELERWLGEVATQHGGSYASCVDADEAVAGADAVSTDVFVSMGQEAERETRLADLGAYQVDDRLTDLLADGGVVLHCLPARYGEEITEAALYGPRSAVWDQAENRLHAQKALLAALLA